MIGIVHDKHSRMLIFGKTLSLAERNQRSSWATNVILSSKTIYNIAIYCRMIVSYGGSVNGPA